ncbi:hypothetical protein AVEN_215956-1, partial [Araneus ventricosus]
MGQEKAPNEPKCSLLGQKRMQKREREADEVFVDADEGNTQAGVELWLN